MVCMLLKIMTQYFHTQLCSMHLGSEQVVDFQTWMRNIIKFLYSNMKILLWLEIYCLESSHIKHLPTVLTVERNRRQLVLLIQFEMVLRYLCTSVITRKSQNKFRTCHGFRLIHSVWRKWRNWFQCWCLVKE